MCVMGQPFSDKKSHVAFFFLSSVTVLMFMPLPQKLSSQPFSGLTFDTDYMVRVIPFPSLMNESFFPPSFLRTNCESSHSRHTLQAPFDWFVFSINLARVSYDTRGWGKNVSPGMHYKQSRAPANQKVMLLNNLYLTCVPACCLAKLFRELRVVRFPKEILPQLATSFDSLPHYYILAPAVLIALVRKSPLMTSNG